MEAGMEHEERATFAGGCFWCIQRAFDHVPGVISTIVGYTGGHRPNPSYEQVCSKTTGHYEAIEVHFDPNRVSYKELLNVYWHNIDPSNSQGQFCDIGPQYRPMIFYHSEEQKRLAEESKQAVLASGVCKDVSVGIASAGPFYPAEKYHQRYYEKSPWNYERYRVGSGREKTLSGIWGSTAGSSSD
jgi:methionine-S-sulfoxide reductase